MASCPRVRFAIPLFLLGVLGLWGCSGGDPSGGATEPEASGQVQQDWYSTNPYDQHGEMTYAAKRAARGHGVTWDCSRRNYFFFYDYRGQLCDGNVATDHTHSSSNVAFFTALWGDRAHSNNHHFLRDDGESLDSACANSVEDLYAGTETALAWREDGDESRFQRAIGVVTHIIQDSFAPAHTVRDSDSDNYSALLDLCSVHEDIPGACRHPEPSFPQSADDADDHEVLAGLAVDATTEYLIAVAEAATEDDPDAVGDAIEAWFQCPPTD